MDGPNAGRDLTGIMHRDYKGTKVRWDITCIPMDAATLSTLLTLIAPEKVSLTYTDPVTNTDKTGDFYSNNFPATMFTSGRGGLWTGLAFPLIEY